MDLHAGRQQRAIDGPRRVVLHEVFIPSLQQQRHAHAAFGRPDQRVAQFAARQKVGIGNDDFLARLANGAAVGALNAAAVAQVVAQYQRRFGAWLAGLTASRGSRRDGELPGIGAPAVACSLELFPRGA